MTMGTSTCHLLLSDREEPVAGMTGVVEDGSTGGVRGWSGQDCDEGGTADGADLCRTAFLSPVVAFAAE